MATNEMFIDVVSDRIEVYREKWKEDYEEAELCCQFENELSGFVELFKLINTLNMQWRESVYEGSCPPDVDDLDAKIKSLLEKWIALDGSVLGLLEFFEAKNYDGGIRGAKEYRECLSEAKDLVARWVPPATAVITSDVKMLLDSLNNGLSKEQCDHLDALAEKALARNEERVRDGGDKWAADLAADMARLGD